MKKIWFLLIAGMMSLGVMAQESFDYEVMPDTIPNLGSRKALRDLNNWNALHNDADTDSIADHLVKIQALEAVTIPSPVGYNYKPLQYNGISMFWGDLSAGRGSIGRLSTDTLIANLNAFILSSSSIQTSLGGKILSVGASTSIPTLIPHVNHSNSGIGGNDLGSVAIIRSGTTRLLADEYGNTLYGTLMAPNISGSGTGTSILRYDRATGDITYADDAGGTAFTFGNGLNETGGAVTLGDTITQNTYITNDDENYYFQIRSAFSGGAQSSLFNVIGGQISLTGWGNGTYDGGGTYHLSVDGHDAAIGSTNEANDINEISIDTTRMRVRDDINSKGLEYYADYSANWGDHSLVTKKWVADNYSGGGSSFLSITTDTIGTNLNADILIQDGLITTLGPKMLNEAATTTNPTLIPNTGETSSGIGGTGLGEVTIVRRGTMRLKADEYGITTYGTLLAPDISGSGTGTSVLQYNRSTGDITYGDAAVESNDVKTVYAASIGRGLTGDTANFQTGATYQRIWYSGPDSLQLDSARAVFDDNDATADVDYNIIFQEERISGSWVNLWSTPVTVSGATSVTTGVKTTTFTVDKIPPYSWIELIFEETAVKPTSFSVALMGSYIK